MARLLGWCVEIFHSYILVVDDILDGSSTRRGKSCWYTLPGVGTGALKDALIMYSSVFEILKEHFGNKPLYSDMVDLFNEALLYTSVGEHMDNTMASRNKTDFSQFTMEKYYNIATFKASYYSFKMPVLMGYLLANNSDRDLHRQVEEVCLCFGRLYQIQNDWFDCYGDESITGKAGNDIQEGKCSWLAVNALKLCNDAQRAVFINNYGDKDPAKVQNIKRLFEDLKLRELYVQEEKAVYENIQLKTSVLPDGDRKMLLNFLNNIIYKRKR